MRATFAAAEPSEVWTIAVPRQIALTDPTTGHAALLRQVFKYIVPFLTGGGHINILSRYNNE